MSLPKIEYPISLIDVHSLGRKVKFRPFLVKEEKILLIAKESKDPDEIKAAIMQIIQNCACEPLEVDKLPLFDIEMIFLKIRARSVGESVKLVFNCQNEVDDVVCNTDTDYVMDLNKVEFEIPEGHNNTVMINSTMGIRLKYPTLTSEFGASEDDLDVAINFIVDNIEYVFDGESVTKPTDLQPTELMEFIDSLTVETLEKIKGFFRTSPKVVLVDHVKCKKCGFEHTLHTEGLLSFFI
jgi:hypothetical protein